MTLDHLAMPRSGDNPKVDAYRGVTRRELRRRLAALEAYALVFRGTRPADMPGVDRARRDLRRDLGIRSLADLPEFDRAVRNLAAAIQCAPSATESMEDA